MTGQALRAPQFGVWSSLPPRTDNPAARTWAPCPLDLKARLGALRDEAAARAQAQRVQAPDCWR